MTPPARINEDFLLDRLTDIFRREGFEGASLSQISESTGLKRASLYHRFPGGKEEMATAVLARTQDRFVKQVVAPLESEGDVRARLREHASQLSTFFNDGNCACILETLSLGECRGTFDTPIKEFFTLWIDALAAAARESGQSPAAARKRAEEVVAQIQGTLILARAMGDTKPFRRVVKNLESTLTS